MREIIQYALATGNLISTENGQDFITVCNKFIASGMQPYGMLQVSGISLIQPFVKYKEKTQNDPRSR